ncbi:MAG: hypothetical protein OXH69_13815 [Acidobacteria bacterium]|nr:hypothetical protein [Acidobacteriota bacterium]
MTATPHHGDDDRFAHFIRLLDLDLFPEPHRVGEDAGRIRREILRLGDDCARSLRCLKEDLKDLQGPRLFPDRHVRTVSFALGPDEYAIYEAVTAYINEFLPQAAGRQPASCASRLARWAGVSVAKEAAGEGINLQFCHPQHGADGRPSPATRRSTASSPRGARPSARRGPGR